MSTKSKWHDNKLIFYDGYEHVGPIAPCVLYDDFQCLQVNKFTSAVDLGTTWKTVETNLNTAIGVAADVVNGAIDMILDADDNSEIACLYQGDQLTWSVKQGLIFETRLTFTTLPTTGTETVQAVWGLASDHNATLNSVATNLWFRLESGAKTTLLWESDDGNTDDDDNSAGTTLTASTYNVYRIDCSDPANGVKFYVSGQLVGTTSDFDTNLTASEAKVQPYFNVSKVKGAANTGTGTMRIDYVRLWQDRS